MNRINIRLVSLIVSLLAIPCWAQTAWQDTMYPYRVSIELAENTTGAVTIDLTSAQIIDLLKPVSIDVMHEDTLAFEKAILVDPATGEVVGGFALTPAGEPLEIDGEFAAWSQGKPSPWGPTAPAHAKVERATIDGKSFGAIHVDFPEPVNGRFGQPVTLKPGQLYLLDYNLLADGENEPISLGIEDPAKTLFAGLHQSYVSKMPPAGVWTHRRVLYRSQKEQAELRVSVAFVSKGATGAIGLRPVKWILQAELKKPTKKLDLYAVATAGHRLTDLNASPIPLVETTNVAKVATSTPSTIDFNPDGVLIDAGGGVKAWNVPNYLPLRAETMHATQPRGTGNGEVRLELCRGTSGTVVLAVDTLTPLAQFTQATCDLPIQPEFNRIAAIPVFDGFWPVAKQIETRFDAMTELNFPLLPPSNSGVHPVAVNFAIPAGASPGTFKGTITLAVQTQEPETKTIQVPIELTILSPVVKATHHFNAMFGSGQITAKYLASDDVGFVKDSISVAEFHGIRGEGIGDNWISRLSRPDRDEPQKAPVRELGRKYNNRLLDFDIVPQLPALFASYSYKIVDQGEGKAPKLEDWEFAEYDKAVDELVVKRDSPWIVVWHTNGHQMDTFDLRDGTVYSHLPGTAEHPRTQLPREEYVSLIADYFEAVAAHLDTKGVLDRTMVLIDESDPSTFQIMYDIATALRTRPHAKRIRYGHTTYKTGTYTQKLPDGRLIMDEVLDVPMPNNDEHFNFFEPEWAARFTRPGKQNWVYYVQTDHLNLLNAGLTTTITPLKLRNYGVRGWYVWAPLCWSMTYGDQELWGSEFNHGPLVNPWLNPYYHHGPGQLSFFYPPDPRGPASEPTDTIIPSYRLTLIRDGIRDYAMLDVLNKGIDDAGNPIKANSAKLAEAEAKLKTLWAGNTVQWYLSYDNFRQFAQDLNGAFDE